ncbi:NrdJb [Chromatiales bacterium (ex Bugula neritina AB1)]|nr:NrdJb [Chromatiales bacterium (ex Bugula neritina AB1)]
MTIKIDHKIVGYSVTKPDPTLDPGQLPAAEIIQMHEALKRPDKLIGSTYKLKTPEHVSEHALYITINDIVLNEGTNHEIRRPFEVFINSKNMDHFQWIVALTRIMSAVFRKGGDVTFLVEELRSVFDPSGGYWNKGQLKQSLVAEIGDVIEEHLIGIGMLRPPGQDTTKQEYIDLKKAEYLSTTKETVDDNTGFPPSAKMCPKCSVKAAILMDGCSTCLNCGDSKCG